MKQRLKINHTKWIFFDIGSTLVDEQVAYNHRAMDMLQSTDITFEEFSAKRIELAKQGYDGNTAAINYYHLTKTPWHHEDERLYTSAVQLLSYLKNKGYRLGIIANQSKGLDNRLKDFGIFYYFDMVVASDEIGVYKPDCKIFTHALESANCSPSCAIMVGDRLDNDVIPAKSLGMQTVWVRNGLARYQDVKLGEKFADLIVDDLAEMLLVFDGLLNGDAPILQQFDSIEQSAMAVVLCKGKILATVEDIYGRKVLSLPKGHNEQGETLLQTAIRECFEETNIILTEENMVKALAPYSYQFSTPSNKLVQKTIAPFLFEVESEGQPIAKEKRMISAQWMEISEFLQKCSYDKVKTIVKGINS